VYQEMVLLRRPPSLPVVELEMDIRAVVQLDQCVCVIDHHAGSCKRIRGEGVVQEELLVIPRQLDREGVLNSLNISESHGLRRT